MDVLKVQSLCTRYNIHPSKKLGQNFLIDPRILRIILDSADLKANDCVVEIGPGFGVLTRELVKKVKQVVAVEIDEKMYQAAKELLVESKNIKLLHKDILKIPNQELIATLSDVQAAAQHSVSESYKVVANLPYSITSAVLRKFTEPTLRGLTPLRGGQTPQCDGRPSLVVVMVQKEVAERVCAEPGEMSILSVAVQYYAKPEIVKIVPRSAFWPEPEVDSAILRIDVTRSYKKLQEVTGGCVVDEQRMFQLVRMGFSSRRKQLQNNLMAGLRIPREQVVRALEAIGLDPKVRAQDLSVGKWVELSEMLHK